MNYKEHSLIMGSILDSLGMIQQMPMAASMTRMVTTVMTLLNVATNRDPIIAGRTAISAVYSGYLC